MSRGNIGGFFHFGLGDGSGTPSLEINLTSKIDIRKPLENINRPYILSLTSLFSLKENKGRKHRNLKRIC